MKRTTFKGALKAAAIMLLLPCAVMAAPPTGGKANTTRPQVGQPVTPQSMNTDLRNLPKAAPWSPGMGIREAHRRVYRPIGSVLPHAPALLPQELIFHRQAKREDQGKRGDKDA